MPPDIVARGGLVRQGPIMRMAPKPNVEINQGLPQIGTKGDQGGEGSQGSQGAQGGQGYQGDQGSQGDQGPQGDTGGPQGPQGDQGGEGPQGGQGDQGGQGSQGNDGAQGPQGPQGAPGLGSSTATASRVTQSSSTLHYTTYVVNILGTEYPVIYSGGSTPAALLNLDGVGTEYNVVNSVTIFDLTVVVP